MSEYEDPHFAYVPPPAPARRRLSKKVKAGLVGGSVLAVLLAVNLGIDDGRDKYEASVKNPSADGRARIIPGEATREQPWLGSPAAAWAEGEAGIVLPEARPVGAFTAEQVAVHLRTVRAFLAAGNLDPATVKGGTPRQALELLTEESREELEAQLTRPTEQDDPALVFSRFDPLRAVPVTDTVKVKGELSFAEGDKGSLVVKTDYSFVYALWPGPEAGRPRSSASPSSVVPAAFGNPVFQARVEREVVRRQQEFHFLDPEKYRVEPGRMAVGRLAASFANNVCTMGSGFLETDFGGSDEDVDTSGKPGDPYDRGSGDAAGDGGCHAIRRT
ncbi:hypothetical protein ACIA8O_02035 [Kitasatospora sp. NPDC051853]|uniref:hypothetical protein n=1 Tax=Kitasatospora sp. NPDC051853 TaxID=3364058 RepID=UPI0037B85E3F